MQNPTTTQARKAGVVFAATSEDLQALRDRVSGSAGWRSDAANGWGGEQAPAVTPLVDVVDGATTLNLGIARFAAEQPGGLDAWLNTPMRDGHGRVVRQAVGEVVDGEELVTF